MNFLLLIKTTPHMILQTHPNTMIAVKICKIDAVIPMINAFNQLLGPYSVLQPNRIVNDASKVPDHNSKVNNIS